MESENNGTSWEFRLSTQRVNANSAIALPTQNEVGLAATSRERESSESEMSSGRRWQNGGKRGEGWGTIHK